MTEAEFLASTDPERMIRQVLLPDALRPWRISDRKLYLWCYAVAVRSGRKCRALMDWGEGRASPQSSRNAAYYAAEWAHSAAWNIPQAAKAALLRDVIGSPWRPIVLDMGCGTRPWAEAHTLALAAHEDRLPDATLDPVRLLILADALEEAGCVDGALLRHLRGWQACRWCDGLGWHGEYMQNVCENCGGTGAAQLPGPHVRGCWAIDAILGLERAVIEHTPNQRVVIDYTNHAGYRRERLIIPVQVWFGTSDHHLGEQWLLEAWDVETTYRRTFAMQSIHSWRPA